MLRYVLHSVSTSLSHHATFHVLANTRVRLLGQASDAAAGYGAGSFLPARTRTLSWSGWDSIETTLAHLLPEMTANIVGALAVLVLLFLEDWRMGLSMLDRRSAGHWLALCPCSAAITRSSSAQSPRRRHSTTRLWSTSAALRSSRPSGSLRPATQSSFPPQRKGQTASSDWIAGQPLRAGSRNGDTPLQRFSASCRWAVLLYMARHTVGGGRFSRSLFCPSALCSR